MAHVYNPRGWQRAPGSSLASQSRLTEGPQVPGRPTLFFFWAAISRLISDLYLHASLHTHMYSQPVHTTCTYKETLSRHKQDLKLFTVCSQNLLLVCLFGGGGGVYVCIVLYIPGWPWTHYVRRVMLRFCSFCLHLPVLGHNIHYTQFIWCLG